MWKNRGHPAIHAGVALPAIGRISQRLVVRRGGPLKCPQMAAHAIGREPLTVELPHCSHPVARITVHRGVRADERKAVLMLIDGMDRDLPAVDPVTEIALRPIFSSMKVGMTILAITAHVSEDWIDVALLARHARMHATEGIPCLAMIKLRLAADLITAIIAKARNSCRILWSKPANFDHPKVLGQGHIRTHGIFSGETLPRLPGMK